jgi:uncharacterized repeat protein (TIGR03803 family)
MQPSNGIFRLTALVAVLTASLVTNNAWAAPEYKVLHAFGTGNDGAGVWSSMVFDEKGDLYGTTSGGGSDGVGTVFELTPHAGGAWTETVLHNFTGNDGGAVFGGLVFDAGILYGTTTKGGAHGFGTVFELRHEADDWDLSVLYSFCARQQCKDGGGPLAGVAIDRRGNLYGTAGLAFELLHVSSGWKEKILYEFCSKRNCSDGNAPTAGLILDPSGNLFGATAAGGSDKECPTGGCGIAYELHRMADGKWKETVLHDFGSFRGDGVGPGNNALVMDGSGNLYGTTLAGGSGKGQCGGTVFKLTPQAKGKWHETVLRSFGAGTDGCLPVGVVLDKTGDIYGATGYGGDSRCGCRVVYKLTPSTSGKWKYTVLHTFTGPDGVEPAASLILDRKGNLYGTTATGGAGGAGVAFELTP